jgi:hypothetical protein
MPHRTDQTAADEAARVAELQREAAAAYAAAQAAQAAARGQLADARAHGNEAAGTR